MLVAIERLVGVIAEADGAARRGIGGQPEYFNVLPRLIGSRCRRSHAEGWLGRSGDGDHAGKMRSGGRAIRLEITGQVVFAGRHSRGVPRVTGVGVQGGILIDDDPFLVAVPNRILVVAEADGAPRRGIGACPPYRHVRPGRVASRYWRGHTESRLGNRTDGKRLGEVREDLFAGHEIPANVIRARRHPGGVPYRGVIAVLGRVVRHRQLIGGNRFLVAVKYRVFVVEETDIRAGNHIADIPRNGDGLPDNDLNRFSRRYAEGRRIGHDELDGVV